MPCLLTMIHLKHILVDNVNIFTLSRICTETNVDGKNKFSVGDTYINCLASTHTTQHVFYSKFLKQEENMQFKILILSTYLNYRVFKSKSNAICNWVLYTLIIPIILLFSRLFTLTSQTTWINGIIYDDRRLQSYWAMWISQVHHNLTLILLYA